VRVQAEKEKKKDKSTLRCLVLVVPEGQAQTTSTLYRTPAASISSFGTLHRLLYTAPTPLDRGSGPGGGDQKVLPMSREVSLGDQPYPGLVRPLRSRRHAPEL
jgi:hypothetical protein